MNDIDVDVEDIYKNMSYNECCEMVELLEDGGFLEVNSMKGKCLLEQRLFKALYKIKKNNISLSVKDIEKIIEIADTL